MNRTAKRFGKTGAEVTPAKLGNDSSHGKAMVTPAPRRTARREKRRTAVIFGSRILFIFLPSLPSKNPGFVC